MSEISVRQLGAGGPNVGAIGLGCMGMSGSYGPAEDAASVATVHAALDAGMTLLDTGDFYGSGHNEMLIGRALAGRRDEAVLSVKFGPLRGPNGEIGGVDARPVAVRNFLAYSLRRLGTDHVDIYRPARLDPAVPIEDTVGAIAEQVQAGRVRHIGLSEVSAETLRRAVAVHPICDVQIELSLLSRAPETTLLPTARELGVAVTAYGVLSRGLISDSTAEHFGPGDFRSRAPRFQGENLAHNRDLVRRLEPMASRHGLTVAQLAIAWALSRGPDVLPVVGMKSPDRVAAALAAAQVRLEASDLAELDDLLPAGAVAGERYGPAQMAALDSERAARPGAALEA